MTRSLIAAIETGGTKILCRVATADADRQAALDVPTHRFATTTPQQAVIDLVGAIQADLRPGDTLDAIGLASFGPLIVDPASPDRGLMLPTPKPHWSGFNLAAVLAQRLGAPVVVETDVAAAAIAEQAIGAARGLDAVAYVTVGSGIGGALCLEGRTLKGALHPEIGHLRLHRRLDDTTPSACPFHTDCAEGLTAGPALGRRLAAGETLAERPDLKALAADYLAQLCASLALAWSPRCIVLGGGVMSTPGLLDAVAAALKTAMGEYGAPMIAGPGYLRTPALEHSGLEGALLMARRQASSR
ncbi:ROK family protein [Phenylobacterium ferrooxidans]|uniref:ROK family protein n=1 Tax=Phenylobacterium ferrooxidans TaxID=2982689 RepID=A0ABW6CP34_9CAUL